MNWLENNRTQEEIELGMSLVEVVSTWGLVSLILCLPPFAIVGDILVNYMRMPHIVSDIMMILGFVCYIVVGRRMTVNARRRYVEKKRAAFQAAKRLEEILQPAIAHVDTKVPSDIMQHCERLRGDNEALERELRRYRAEGRIDDTDAIMLIRVYASRRKKNKESSERLAAVFGGTYGIEEY